MAPPKESSAMTASRYSNGYSSDQQSDSNDEAAGNSHGPAYLVEHLATFRVGSAYEVESPKDGLRKLFQMEKTKGIWTQKMSIRLETRWMVIIDEENGEIVERFPMSLISEPTAFTSNDPRELYNNILVFIVKDDQPKGANSDAEMHIFQCVRTSAQEVVSDVKTLMMGKGLPKKNGQVNMPPLGRAPRSVSPGHPQGHTSPPPTGGVNVREQVSIFNNVKSESRLSLSNRGGDSDGGPSVHSVHSTHPHQQHGHGHGAMGGAGTLHELRPQDMRSIGQSGAQALRSSQHAQYRRSDAADVGGAGGQHDDSSSTGSERYEKDVAILNHCFDDIERFIARLQNAATAYKELEKRRKVKKGGNKTNKKDMGEGLLSMRAKPPPQKEFEDILAKFKLSFNLLAKLRNHIHDPNSPELIHFLFTPLAVIVDAARDFNFGPNLASKVVAPLLTRDACELLDNCCTSKENDLWRSLGDAWSVPRDQWKNYEDTYQPVFTDGWAPEYPHFPEEIGPELTARRRPEEYARGGSERYEMRADSPAALYGHSARSFPEERARTPSEHDFVQRSDVSSDSMEPPGGIDAQRHFERQQTLFVDELKAAQAKCVQVMYPRTANNDKELTVIRGEYLEVLDDSRKWWKTRNIRGQIGHVPHTIVAPVGDSDYHNNGYESTNNYSPSESPVDGYGGGRIGSQMGPMARSPNSQPAPAEWVRRERQGKKEGMKLIVASGDCESSASSSPASGSRIPSGPSFPTRGGSLHTEQITMCKNHRGFADSFDALHFPLAETAYCSNVAVNPSFACGDVGPSATPFCRAEFQQLDKTSAHSLVTEEHHNTSSLATADLGNRPMTGGHAASGYPPLCERHRENRRHSPSLHKSHEAVSRYTSPVLRRALDDMNRPEVSKSGSSEDTKYCRTLPRSHQPAPRCFNSMANEAGPRDPCRFGSVDHFGRGQYRPLQKQEIDHHHHDGKSHNRHHQQPHDSFLVIPTPPPLPKWTTRQLEKQKSIGSWSQTSNALNHGPHGSGLAHQMSLLPRGSHGSLSSLRARRRSSDMDSVSTRTETNVSISQNGPALSQAAGGNNSTNPILTHSTTGKEIRNFSPSSFSAMDQLNEELQAQLTLLRRQREQATKDYGNDDGLLGAEGDPVLTITRRRKLLQPTVYTYITPESNPEEVREWMLDKGFEPATVEACRGRTGKQMFTLTTETLADHPQLTREELRKLISHLTVQKNLCGYKPRSDGLEELLRRRKNFVEGSGTLDELMSPEGDSSYSASETQKSGESKDDQGIHVHCAPTPPPKSRERIVYTWSKDGTVLPRSKEMLSGSGRNSPTSASSSLVLSPGSTKSVLDSKDSVDSPEATSKNKHGQTKDRRTKVDDASPTAKEACTGDHTNGRGGAASSRPLQICAQEIQEVETEIYKTDEVPAIGVPIKEEGDDRENTRM
ncbi:uncharacterized protein LOC111255315 isoform X5 [Varroa destructor]|nr:uncharacterized protein LOC111255315 isoform X5 [Varroa destructor]XP_022672902.1 uncharacterized protein LOC111255315 isoform X5 [Varroa destructor]XP_022672903.1 uncharacterized protein LOC111255315 isoform X5 [Varroa destructor]XP_022672904.1 uncharacterized protein LOC111255315 isoform X5 [Varroa destructor]XP_022672905.1 uncharacterized protein LOC111255315 isoform X5 [Varroa destructor]XP_022672908.1 uncharacterized protein LOC111255315 isoform X5 [Varroa destructor]